MEDSYPDIVFRDGPGGRRPGLVAGPDVWEVIRVFRELETDSDTGIEQTARLTNLSREQVKAAARYYAAFRVDIARWIQRADDEADRAEAAWRRGQEQLPE